MIFRQVTQEDLGCASYLIGDEGAGLAAVVDPRLDIDEYLRLARYMARGSTREVWPGHLGGSLCGGPGMDLKVCSTIGYERAHQQMLRIEDEDEFVRRAIDALGPQPPNFRTIVAMNTGPLARGGTHADPMTPRQLEQHQREGATTTRRGARSSSPPRWASPTAPAISPAA